jgi:hypothetical protein
MNVRVAISLVWSKFPFLARTRLIFVECRSENVARLSSGQASSYEIEPEHVGVRCWLTDIHVAVNWTDIQNLSS